MISRTEARLLCLLAILSCFPSWGSLAMPSDDKGAALPASAKPAVDLGPDLKPIRFSPGRYAIAIQRTLQGTHALQRVRMDSTASFLLDLAADGTATACRGWRYFSFNDGPQIHTEERLREQQGYRGRHVQRGGFVEVELKADDSVCPPKREYTPLVPRRSSTVKLRCVLAAPRDGAAFTEPALLCQWIDLPTREQDAYLVDDVAPRGWMILGSGPGLRVKVTGSPPGARSSEPTAVAVGPAPAPLGPNAWEISF